MLIQTAVKRSLVPLTWGRLGIRKVCFSGASGLIMLPIRHAIRRPIYQMMGLSPMVLRWDHSHRIFYLGTQILWSRLCACCGISPVIPF